MRNKLFITLAIAASLLTGKSPAQESAPRLLTLDEAIQLAVSNNRTLKVTSLEVDKSKWQIAETKTKRLPSFTGTVLGSQLLNEVSFIIIIDACVSALLNGTPRVNSWRSS